MGELGTDGQLFYATALPQMQRRWWWWWWCCRYLQRLLGRKNINKCESVVSVRCSDSCNNSLWIMIIVRRMPYHISFLLLFASAARNCPIKSHRSLMVHHIWALSVGAAVITTFLFMFCNCVAPYFHVYGCVRFWNEFCVSFWQLWWRIVCTFWLVYAIRHFKCDAHKKGLQSLKLKFSQA